MDGAFHNRLIFVGETGVALRSVGGSGLVGGVCANTCPVENMTIAVRITNVSNDARLNRFTVRLWRLCKLDDMTNQIFIVFRDYG